ncbi:MAG: hypothetical protein JSW47_20830, partial [Phycisphaerales bacterium]
MKRHLTEEELIEHKFKLASDEQAAGAAEHLAGCAECRQRLELLGQKFAALDLLAEDVAVSDELIAQTVAQAKQPVRRRIIPFGRYHWIGTAAAVLVLGLVFLIDNSGRHEPERSEFGETRESEMADKYRRSASRLEVKKGEQVRVVAKGLSDERSAQLVDALVSNQLATKPATAPSITSADSPAEDLSVAVTSRPDAEESTRQYAFAQRGRGSALEKTDETAKLGAARELAPEPMQPTTVAWAETPKDADSVAGTALGESVVAKISEKSPFAPASAIELVTLPRRDSVQLTIYNSTFGASVSDYEGQGGYKEYALAMLIQGNIQPESWFDLSDTGEGTIEVYDNTKLVVRQRREIHQEIEKFLRALREPAGGTVK